MSTRYRESQYILYIVQRCAPRIKEVAKCKTMFRKLPSLYGIPTLVWPSVSKLIFSVERYNKLIAFLIHFISFHLLHYSIVYFVPLLGGEGGEGGLRGTKKQLCVHEKSICVTKSVVFEDLDSNATKNCSVRSFFLLSPPLPVSGRIL